MLIFDFSLGLKSTIDIKGRIDEYLGTILSKSQEPLCGYLFGNASGNRSLDDALATLSGFDAAMDEPYMLLYEEIMAAFPEAKFLLTISDAESWFNNYVDIMHSYQRAHASLTDGRPFYHQDCTGMRSWGCNFVDHAQNQTEADYASRKETCLQNYERHIERVQQVIPPEKLLVYNWSDGWAPLTHFLHLPVPEEEFPKVDEVKIHLDVRGKIMDALGMNG